MPVDASVPISSIATKIQCCGTDKVPIELHLFIPAHKIYMDKRYSVSPSTLYKLDGCCANFVSCIIHVLRLVWLAFPLSVKKIA